MIIEQLFIFPVFDSVLHVVLSLVHIPFLNWILGYVKFVFNCDLSILSVWKWMLILIIIKKNNKQPNRKPPKDKNLKADLFALSQLRQKHNVGRLDKNSK